MNFLDKVGEKILDCVLAALGRQLGYLIHYKSNVDNLNTQVKELGEARDRVKHGVDSAEWNGMKIYADVERRLTESDDIIAVAEIILEDDRPAKITYCNGWCPNLMSRYRVSKRADKAASEAKNLKDEILKIDSDRVGYHESTQVVETVTSNKGYEAFESRKPTITGVLEALKDPNITRIGIHGMGGVGKTMLVNEVLKQAEKGKLFDKYLFLVVSNDPDLKRIQREIAEQLDLESVKETELVRRDQLRKRLKQENRVLIILDDIWKELDLEALGIFSFGDDNKGCKLLLTSRFYNVVCNGMDTQKQFEVKVFLNNEARNLFEKIVGDLAKTSEIEPTMLQIVEECAGLPIAITTVANALKNQKNPRIWKDFLNQLKMSSPREIQGMNEVVYKSIKMSYEFLKSNEAKSLLLLCSLHGEDDDIEVEDLLRYGVGLGLFDNVDKIEGARCRVHTLVERLKDSSLLLDGDDNGTVKMHDVIRDVVINIAAEERHMYTIRTVNELQTRSKRKDTVAISLPYINDDLDLPNQFECSKLELLLLFHQEVDFRIPDSFFEGLKDLKVLKLSLSWYGVLPSSLSSLENLQTLCLDGEVPNAIIIGELKNLKALSLSLSYTERLPKEIGQLTHLQLLDLGKCSRLKFIPPSVLSNLKMLEELYLPKNVELEIEAQSTERINAMFSELDHLSYLTKLHICIENAKILPNAVVFERLESYRIAIGSAWAWGETSETSRILKLKISFQSDYGYKGLFRKCETLILDKMKGVKNNLYELDSEGFQGLKHLTVQHNDEIQYIFKSMGVLDSVYTGHSTKTFCNLRVVTVSKCCKLESVFSLSMVECFSHLQEMNINDCKIMSAIVATEGEEEIVVNSDDSIEFANLHSLKLRNLFKLKGFLSIVDSLVLFNEKVVFPNLEKLEIAGMDSMKMIWSNQLTSDCFGKLETMTFAKLVTLEIDGCSSLKSVFPTSVAKALMQLEKLRIEYCATVEEIVAKEEGIETTTLFVFQKLTALRLRNLPELKSFYPGKHISKWLLLTHLRITNCDKLKIFGSTKSSDQETNELAHHANLTQQPLFFIEKNAIIIGELKNLKALSLSLSSTERLPKEIGQLTHLQLLDLRECSELKFPPNVLSNLKRLEELYLPDDVEWEVEVQGTEKINAMVSELDHLSHLTKLHISIENAKILPKPMVFESLESYKIAIGSAWDWDETWETSRILKLKISFQSDCGYKVLFRKCETLVLEEMKGVKNILYELDSEGFQCLKHLKVEKNDEIQYIIKSMGVQGTVFPILESIKLRYANNLERISYTPTESFCNLRVVKVSNCCQLEFVFFSSMVACFSRLQEMNIEDCKIMSAIVAIERKEEIEVNSDDIILFVNLHSLKLRNIFKLRGFLSVVDSFVLFNGKVVFPNLEELEIEGMDSMKMIWPDQLILDSFCKLENLTVSNFTNLTNILPPNMLRTLQNLKHLKIDSCGSIEEVFEIQRTNNVEETHDIAATELRSLKLINLGKLKHMWSMDPQGIITFAKLCKIEIKGCSSLKSVFPTSVAKALMQLEELEIKDCATVEEIVAKEEGIETATLFVFPRLFSLNLVSLPEFKSFYPGKHTLEWPLLNQLIIYKCDKLKIFGSHKESIEETNGLDHDVSVIQQRFFFSEKDKFPNLEELELDEGDAMNETCGGPSAEFCCNLKQLTLNGNGEIPNVEAPIARAGVSDFRRLKNIVPFSSTSFQYLKELKVFRSDVLISLLTPSTARTLVQLQHIEIARCERMTEIVANEGSEAEAGDEIAFNNLTFLGLFDLPSLTAFHLGNRTIKFPSLDEVVVEKCPKLKIFCSGVLSTPKLREVWMGEKWVFKEEGDGDFDLNATIKEYWEAKLETCDQKFAEKTDASEGGESEHDANDDLERETTSEVGDTQCDGE